MHCSPHEWLCPARSLKLFEGIRLYRTSLARTIERSACNSICVAWTKRGAHFPFQIALTGKRSQVEYRTFLLPETLATVTAA